MKGKLLLDFFLFLLCFWKVSKSDSQQQLFLEVVSSVTLNPYVDCVENASIQENEPENPFTKMWRKEFTELE